MFRSAILFSALLLGCDAPGAADARGPVAAAQTTVDYPRLSGRVVDAAGLLDTAAIDALVAGSAKVEQARGHQFVVVTVPTLGGQRIEDYGLGLGRHWGVGRAGHDDGILLLVAPNERQVRIEVGYGLERKVPDELAGQIMREHLLPAFRDNRMQDGILAGAAAIRDVLLAGDKQE